MSVTLRKRVNKDGTTSLRLDIYHNGKRYPPETLKHLQLAKPSNLADREQNKQKLQLAQQIAVARAAELEATNYNMVTDAGKKTSIEVWMQAYIAGYTKKDKRNMQGALNRFTAFLKNEKKSGLPFGGLTPLLIEDFIEYLESRSEGEGAVSYYSRFKKMLKQAYKKNLMKENILDKVEGTASGRAKKKDTLTLDEIRILAATPTESTEVRRAFLFACVTGLRWCDVKPLTWSHINLPNKSMQIKAQAKTELPVYVPLNDTAIKLLGAPDEKNTPVFKLPSSTGANKSLKAWVRRAGINKAITFHNGRHSFGTNLVFNDVDVLTASKLLGHTSTKHTHRYVDAAEEMKQRATDKLNIEL